MNIGIYNLEPEYFNLALEKIIKYHQQRGDDVENYMPLFHRRYDKIYASSIFTWTNKSYVQSNMITGGSGFSLKTKLSKKIERIKVYKNIGFTTRGCIRQCGFCNVWKAEGGIKATGDIYDFWDGESRNITLYDNNILAKRRHFIKIIGQIHKENLIAYFKQGFDLRLVDDEIARKIMQIKHGKQIYFAWDRMEDEQEIKRGLQCMIKHLKPTRTMIYVLSNYDTTIGEDIYRIEMIRDEFNCDPFIMLYDRPNADGIHNALAKYCNRFVYRSQTFKQYCCQRKIGNEYIWLEQHGFI